MTHITSQTHATSLDSLFLITIVLFVKFFTVFVRKSGSIGLLVNVIVILFNLFFFILILNQVLCFSILMEFLLVAFSGSNHCKARVPSRGSESSSERNGVCYRSSNFHVNIFWLQPLIPLRVTIIIHGSCCVFFFKKISGVTFLVFNIL